MEKNIWQLLPFIWINDMTNLDPIKLEAERIEEDCLYSAKGHFCAGHWWGKVNFWLGISSTSLSAIAGTSALSQFDYHNVIAGALSIFVAFLAGLITFINPDNRSFAHLKAGNNYNSLRNNARIFHDIETGRVDEKTAIKILKKLNETRNKLNTESLQIPEWAFKKARKGIELGEASYRADKN